MSEGRFLLKNLPLPVRLTLAMFLIASGVGYLTGLIQLHFAHAKNGNLLPSKQDAIETYHGQTGDKKTQMVRLLDADEALPFNGNGSMRAAFFTKSDDWKEAVKGDVKKARAEREGEINAVLEWLKAGADKKAFDEDAFIVSEKLKSVPITRDFVKIDDNSKEIVPRTVAVKSIIDTRCTRCHTGGGEAERFLITNYEQVMKYHKEPSSGVMSLERLASITHTHMMAFAVLFGCTGLVFAATSYPPIIRALFGPWTLFFQVLDIACWWLGRIDPLFAEGIVYTGALVGVGLFIQIVGGLLDLFRVKGKLVLLLLFIAAGGIGFTAKLKYIDPYLEGKAKAAKKG